MGWIDLFMPEPEPEPDLPEMSDSLSGTSEMAQDMGLPDLPDLPEAFSANTKTRADQAEAFERLLWCLDAYRVEGLHLHFYAVNPKPEFAMVYPEAFTPSERIMVQDCFLGAVDLIAAHARELANGSYNPMKLAA
ncbi:hypothetical protein [Desulfocurvibacter africanus]|uniref:hypothetical protein n=1 Tax=Desulfocurvibacter africanus TaxID=873 RepID=UPI0003F95C9C|nr:hypothetical protein [Desulfocurvibacter africanus]